MASNSFIQFHAANEDIFVDDISHDLKKQNSNQFIDGAMCALLMAMSDRACQMVFLFLNCCFAQIAHSIN